MIDALMTCSTHDLTRVVVESNPNILVLQSNLNSLLLTIRLFH